MPGSPPCSRIWSRCTASTTILSTQRGSRLGRFARGAREPLISRAPEERFDTFSPRGQRLPAPLPPQARRESAGCRARSQRRTRGRLRRGEDARPCPWVAWPQPNRPPAAASALLSCDIVRSTIVLQSITLLGCNPASHILLENHERNRAAAEHHVMEPADVELRSERLLGFRPQRADLHLSGLVSKRLTRPCYVTVNFVRDVDQSQRAVRGQIVDRLLARPPLPVYARVDHEPARAPHVERKASELAVWILVEPSLFAE